MMFWQRKRQLQVIEQRLQSSIDRVMFWEERLQRLDDKISSLASSPPLFCSFCRKSQHDVKKLFAAPAACICDDCTRLAMDILIEEGRK